MGGMIERLRFGRRNPAGGGFFGSSPPGVKVIAVNYTVTVAPNTGATFFTIATPTFFSIPAGKSWRFHSCGSVSPTAVASQWDIEWQVGGVALGGDLFPLYTGATWATPAFGASTWELDLILTNPNSGGVWNYDYRIFNNAKGAAPAVTDITELSSNGALNPTVALGIQLKAATTVAGATVTHQQTIVEQLQ